MYREFDFNPKYFFLHFYILTQFPYFRVLTISRVIFRQIYEEICISLAGISNYLHRFLPYYTNHTILLRVTYF